MRWIEVNGEMHYVAADGEIIARVTEGWLCWKDSGTGRQYTDCESACAAVEARVGADAANLFKAQS